MRSAIALVEPYFDSYATSTLMSVLPDVVPTATSFRVALVVVRARSPLVV